MTQPSRRLDDQAFGAAMLRLPIIRIVLVLFPVLFAARTAVTALWSAPAGPYPLDEPVPFDVVYWSATGLYLYWATISRAHLKRSVYIGWSLAFLCMYRAITIVEARTTFGNVAYSAVVNWVSFSLATVLVTLISAQYIIVRHMVEDDL